MKCNEFDSLMLDYLDKTLNNDHIAEFESHFDECAGCRLKLEQTRTLLMQIALSPMPEPDVDAFINFEKMLNEEIKNQKHGKIYYFNKPIIKFSLRAAAAIILLLIVFGLGINSDKKLFNNGHNDDVADLQKEMKDMKKMLMFSLLKQESASDRIKAVNYADEISTPDPKVIEALFTTMNTDKNPNVRLAAVYSLTRFSNLSYVRDSLIKSLELQTEPIVQITLINLLVEMQEVKAINTLKEIKLKAKIPEVKEQADRGLKSLKNI